MPLGVMQIIDSLVLSGAESVAVNIANALPTDRYRSHLCATRREGALRERIAPHVGVLSLGRRGRFDVAAFARLRAYIARHDIRILHAHSSSLFIALLMGALPPFPIVIWHDHFGRYLTEERPARLYVPAVHRARAVIAVNQALARWSIDRLGMPAARVHYVPNFVELPPASGAALDLPGEWATRVICVANLRPQKDHLTLIEAFAGAAARVPAAHLLIVGDGTDAAYRAAIEAAIDRYEMRARVHLLGARRDTADLLRACAVGVLSSESEGLPLALIEYGAAGLAAVATNVGQCAEVLDGGHTGLIVPPHDAPALADALVTLLTDDGRRSALASAFSAHVAAHYSAASGIARIEAIYAQALAG